MAKWTQLMLARLEQHWDKGLSARQISELMSHEFRVHLNYKPITRNAVIGKVYRLGLEGRDSPIIRIGKDGKKRRSKPRPRKLKPQAIAVLERPKPHDDGPRPAPPPAPVPKPHDDGPRPAPPPAPVPKPHGCLYPMWRFQERPTGKFCGKPRTNRIKANGQLGELSSYCISHYATCYYLSPTASVIARAVAHQIGMGVGKRNAVGL